MMDDFDTFFFNEVLRPQIFIPMKPEPIDQPESITSTWTNLYDANRTKEMFNMTVEWFGRDLTVYLDGTLERFNPMRYTGTFKDEKFIIEENEDRLMVLAPTNLENWLLTGMKMMDEPKKETDQAINQVVVLECPIERGYGNISFALTLFYKFA
eukprot:GFUD01011867.1.p1 GENE.GFUD01011867.1~~GFUD01011867.1.p1  ORF type:complete len:154 (-),score=18.78 GFUD01011867.1:1141-1602(-)